MRAAFFTFLLLPIVSASTGLSLILTSLFGGSRQLSVGLCAASVATLAASWLVYTGARRHLAVSDVEEGENGENEAGQAQNRENAGNQENEENRQDRERNTRERRERRRREAYMESKGRRSKEKRTIISIPYYVIRINNETSMFKPADRFELLKLSVKLRDNKKEPEKAPLFSKPDRENKTVNTQEKGKIITLKPEISRKEVFPSINLPNMKGIKNKFLAVFHLDSNQKKPKAAKPQQPEEAIAKLESITARMQHLKDQQPEEKTHDLKTVDRLAEKDRVKEQGTKRDEDQSKDDLCITCCNAETNCAFLPCLHGGLCFSCGKLAFEERQYCPLCNCRSLAVVELERTVLPNIQRSVSINLLPVAPAKQ